jgi:hypothetical protein
MASSRTNALAVGATLLGGALAGMAVNKTIVEMPAWGEVGVIPWASFTTASDQGLGLILFPIIGGSALLLTVAAAVAFHYDRTAPRSGAAPVYGAPILAIAALVATVFLLAPPRLSLAQAGGNAVELQRIFASVTRWWDIKALLHVLTFVSNLWALVAVLRGSKEGRATFARGLQGKEHDTW